MWLTTRAMLASMGLHGGAGGRGAPGHGSNKWVRVVRHGAVVPVADSSGAGVCICNGGDMGAVLPHSGGPRP